MLIRMYVQKPRDARLPTQFEFIRDNSLSLAWIVPAMLVVGCGAGASLIEARYGAPNAWAMFAIATMFTFMLMGVYMCLLGMVWNNRIAPRARHGAAAYSGDRPGGGVLVGVACAPGN